MKLVIKNSLKRYYYYLIKKIKELYNNNII